MNEQVAKTTKVQQVASRRSVPEQDLHPVEDLLEYFHEYTRQKPEVVALWSFGIGFVLGWKLKLW